MNLTELETSLKEQNELHSIEWVYAGTDHLKIKVMHTCITKSYPLVEKLVLNGFVAHIVSVKDESYILAVFSTK